jgi:peroxiredoxin
MAFKISKILLPLSIISLAWALPTQGAIPMGAEGVTPLKVGERAPTAIVKTLDGADFDLGRAFATKPTVLIFYRGGWCPFCNRQLSGIQDYEPKFVALGYQILAVCTDKPGDLKATLDKHQLTYTLLSDRAMSAASAFRVAYRLTDQDEKKYGTYHIGVPEIPGEAGAHWLPVPSIFIIGSDGIIKFVEFNANYQIRPPTEEILKAASQVQHTNVEGFKP